MQLISFLELCFLSKMNLYSKIIFFLIIFFIFSLTHIFEKTTTTRAIQKILILVISIIIFLTIVFPGTFAIGLANIMGVGRGTDAVFYLYIITSLAINLILFKKLSESESRISRIIQSLALNSSSLEKKK